MAAPDLAQMHAGMLRYGGCETVAGQGRAWHDMEIKER